jgi:hypothetical protein
VRALLLALSAAWTLATAAGAADKPCPDGCHERNSACRKSCAQAGGTSEEQMLCRGRCVEQEDECRCGCGERAFCAGGNKGGRGCGNLVAWALPLPAARR